MHTDMRVEYLEGRKKGRKEGRKGDRWRKTKKGKRKVGREMKKGRKE